MIQIGREVGKNQRQIQDLKKGAPGGGGYLPKINVGGLVWQNHYFFQTVPNFLGVKYFFLPIQVLDKKKWLLFIKV